MSVRTSRKTPSGTRELTDRSRDIGIAIPLILIATLVSVFGAYTIFRAHLTVADLFSSNSVLIATWRQVGDGVDYLLDNGDTLISAENDSIVFRIQARIKDKMQQVEDLNIQYEKHLERLKKQPWIFANISENDMEILEQDVSKLLHVRAYEASTAVPNIVRGGFSHWSTATKVFFKGETLISPLQAREMVLRKAEASSTRTIWQLLSLISALLFGIICFVWLRLLLPAVKDLAEARRELRMIFDAIPGMVGSYSSTGHLQMANQSYMERLGKPNIGVHASGVVGSQAWEIVRPHFEKAMKGERREFDTPLITSRGKRMHCASYVPIREKDGHISRIIALVTDVQDRYDNDRALRESEEKLRITLNSIGDAVISTDRRGTVVHMNPVACQLTGWPAEEAVGESLEKVFHIINQKSRKKIESPVDKVLNSGMIVGLANNTVLLSRDGREYVIKDSGAPIFSLNDEIVGVVLVFRDATEEIAINERLIRNEKMRAIGQLAGGIAHDINNHLAVIRGYSEILSGPMSEEIDNKEALTQIIATCDRAAGLTRKLKVFSQQKLSETSAVDIKEILLSILDILRDTTDRRIQFSSDLDVEKAFVPGNPDLLQSAFMNICLNSIQEMSTGGSLHIALEEFTIRSREYSAFRAFDLAPGEYLRVVFQDTGSGIVKENLERIFEPYFSTKPADGSGMGLAMVFSTVLEHKGAVIAENAKFGGAIFTIVLPVFDQSKLPARPRPVLPDPPDISKICILLVDDETNLRHIWEMALSKSGCSVICANDGKSALEIYLERKSEIDLIFLDLNMPRMGGLEFLEKLKEIGAQVSIIIMTGLPGQIEDMLATNPLIVSVLYKPFSHQELFRALHEYTNHVSE
ncbi:PAS domain S-box-containing protein [Rhodovulum imhoffii]|uniref:histidine kinase n=1 Tax=Rhodovulum imhoffii TaxID=365340 RepID=A0A2T5BL11_9RHOB|nr:PAS domain S-box protein [Rhodovulum imhoffii]PTM99691.1 PAS domain S-box-containing protein [Rhodovulum imhoffii]